MNTDGTISLSSEYGYLIISLVLVCIHYIFVMFFFVGRARGKVFTKEFMERNFNEVHRHELGADAPRGGYPDMGNGRYSERLTYAEWYEFNNAQRAHYNYLEHLPVVLFLGVAAGIKLPLEAAIAEMVYLIGRVFYSIGYVLKGPSGRLIGALLADLGLLALLGLGLYSGISIAW